MKNKLMLLIITLTILLGNVTPVLAAGGIVLGPEEFIKESKGFELKFTAKRSVIGHRNIEFKGTITGTPNTEVVLVASIITNYGNKLEYKHVKTNDQGVGQLNFALKPEGPDKDIVIFYNLSNVKVIAVGNGNGLEERVTETSIYRFPQTLKAKLTRFSGTMIGKPNVEYTVNIKYADGSITSRSITVKSTGTADFHSSTGDVATGIELLDKNGKQIASYKPYELIDTESFNEVSQMLYLYRLWEPINAESDFHIKLREEQRARKLEAYTRAIDKAIEMTPEEKEFLKAIFLLGSLDDFLAIDGNEEKTKSLLEKMVEVVKPGDHIMEYASADGDFSEITRDRITSTLISAVTKYEADTNPERMIYDKEFRTKVKYFSLFGQVPDPISTTGANLIDGLITGKSMDEIVQETAEDFSDSVIDIFAEAFQNDNIRSLKRYLKPAFNK